MTKKELEKEAKDYANKWLWEVKELELKHRTDPKPEYIRIQQAYIDGAEFGYNKANEWQYVSEKGIPKVKGNYHVWLGKYNYALTYFDETKLWIVSDDPVDGWIDLKDVIAWKEIVFLELKESE